jgi:Mor family transcriptional regulator
MTQAKRQSAISAVTGDFLQEAQALLVASLTRGGVAPDTAANVALFAVTNLAKAFGGQTLYFPKGKKGEAAARDAAIFARMGKAEPAYQIASAFEISVHAVRKAFHRERARRKNPSPHTGKQ